MRGQGAVGRPGAALEPCNCSEAVLASEQEKLAVLRRMETHMVAMAAQLQRSNVCQEQMLELKRRKLDLEERRLLLAEAQFIQGPLIPNILPQGG